MTTPLGRKIIDIIRQNGPIPVADYFALCLADPQHGYYHAQEPFGARGDFVTAPEISQLFGELIGIFMIMAWRTHDRPRPVQLIELGPGRGTLMADMQRVIGELDPEMASTTRFHLVETSERLREVQRKTLQPLRMGNEWHQDLQSVAPGFTLLVANEFFDALPIRQFVFGPDGFHERVIALTDRGELGFATGLNRIEHDLPPVKQPPPGTILELSPSREAMMATVTQRLKRDNGTALIIDYGHLDPGFGDTLQAVRNHHSENVLARPGEADLTSHVDFAALARVARTQGAAVATTISQGEFLLGLGLLERAGALGTGKSAQVQEAIGQAVDRLAGNQAHQMGKLFKALYVSAQPLDIAPFETAD